ncbi:uncharacterized protein [Asterias amurensis]|uniref:uncharacterized protein n=1 Tax=Asterias amurensis TaxID=7602 RepID=UPI003AB1935D
MTTPPPPSPQDNHLWKSQPRQQISPHHQPHYSSLKSFHSNGKMKLGKTTSCPSTQGELPPLVGVPHIQEKSRFDNPTTPDSTASQTFHHVPLSESEFSPAASAGSPLIHRRLKFMVRQCSDSELLKHRGNPNLPSGGSAAASPVPIPHPPDASPRSRNSSGSNSPQVFRKLSLLNPAVAGVTRASRSLEGSPMNVRRIRGGAKQQGGGESPTPIGNEPGKTRRTRPFSFGSFTDVLQHVANTGEASPRSGGSPYIVRRSASLRGGTLVPSSRPDTPATESMYDTRKSHHHSSSSGERNGVDDSDVTSIALEDSSDIEGGNIHLRRRLRHDSSSQHGQRNSIGHLDYNRNLPKQQPPYDDQDSDHEVDDDTNFPSNLYDIQERRESVLSIEACQEIARRVAANEIGNAAEKNDSDEHDDTRGDHTTTKTKGPSDSTPEYRKLPLSTDVRVTCWLKGIQDPTEVAPPKFDRILPEII